MFEHAGDRKESDFSFIDGANMTPRASYWHMELVAKYFTGTFLKGTSCNTDFMVYGAQDGDQMSVMIMNRGFSEAKEYTLYLKDPKIMGTGLNFIVQGKRKGVYKDVIQPRSTQVLVFKGKSISKINYTSDDFDHQRPPVYSKVK